MKIQDNLWIDSTINNATTRKTTNDQDFSAILNHALAKDDDKKLMEASKQFESVFLYQLLSQMRSTVPKDSLFEESPGEEMFTGMLDEEYSNQMSEAGGIGLAQMLFEQLKQKTK